MLIFYITDKDRNLKEIKNNQFEMKLNGKDMQKCNQGDVSNHKSVFDKLSNSDRFHCIDIVPELSKREVKLEIKQKCCYNDLKDFNFHIASLDQSLTGQIQEIVPAKEEDKK